MGGLLVALVAGLTAAEVWRQHATTVRDAEARVATLSLALGEQTTQSFRAVDLIVAKLAEQVAAGQFTDLDSAEMGEELRERIVGAPFILGLAIVDREGRMLAMTRPKPEPRPVVTDREFFGRHRDDPGLGLLVGVPFRNAVDGRWIIPLSRGLRDRDGAFAGAIVAAVDPAWLQDIYSKVLPPEGGAFGLYRADGIMLTRFPAIEEAVGQDFSHLKVFEEIRQGADRPFWVPNGMDNTPRLVSFTPAQGYPVVLTVSLSRQALLQRWKEYALGLAVAAAVTSAAMVAALAAQTSKSRPTSE
ncbi:MAG: cache domain-containing protein [Actinomycetota bacterium]